MRQFVNVGLNDKDGKYFRSYFHVTMQLSFKNLNSLANKKVIKFNTKA